MYESESSTFEAKFKLSVAILSIENTFPYPGNERSAALIEKDVGSATSPSVPWPRLVANLAKSSAAYRRYPAFSSPVFRVRPKVAR
jgi:hypothetical protein